MNGMSYRGHYIRFVPDQDQGRWMARVVVAVHSQGQVERIYYRDHTQSYSSREDAEVACAEFGKRMVDEFVVPASGEGEYREKDAAGQG